MESHSSFYSVLSMLNVYLIGVITCILLLIWYSSRRQSYWKALGVPYVKPLPLIGSIWEYTFKPLQDVELARYKKFGKIYGHYEGNRPLLSVADPDLIRSILVKDFHAFTQRRNMDTGDKLAENMVSVMHGERWKRVRTIITPTFTTGKIRRTMSIFKDCSVALIDNFRKRAEKGEPIDVKSIYNAVTMDIIASAAFSTKIDSHNEPNNPFVKTAKAILIKNINWRAVLLAFAPDLMKALKIPIFDRKLVDFFSNATLQIIEERKKTGQTRNDFLQLMMDTAKETADEGKLEDPEENDITENYGKDENKQIFKMATKKSLSHMELIANCVIFFLAGYESSASVLSYVSYLLALNPEVQEKTIQELDDALERNNGELTYDVVQSLKYMDNVISETLRIYPPAVRLERMADENYQLGDTGIEIPKGMLITIPVFALHRDPAYFPDPEKFDPDRFKPEERAKRHQYVYLPFGAGPRNCIGMRFALMEAKVCLAYVLSNFRLKRCAQTKVPLEFYFGQGFLLAKEIILKFEIRNDCVKVR